MSARDRWFVVDMQQICILDGGKDFAEAQEKADARIRSGNLPARSLKVMTKPRVGTVTLDPNDTASWQPRRSANPARVARAGRAHARLHRDAARSSRTSERWTVAVPEFFPSRAAAQSKKNEVDQLAAFHELGLHTELKQHPNGSWLVVYDEFLYPSLETARDRWEELQELGFDAAGIESRIAHNPGFEGRARKNPEPDDVLDNYERRVNEYLRAKRLPQPYMVKALLEAGRITEEEAEAMFEGRALPKSDVVQNPRRGKRVHHDRQRQIEAIEDEVASEYERESPLWVFEGDYGARDVVLATLIKANATDEQVYRVWRMIQEGNKPMDVLKKVVGVVHQPRFRVNPGELMIVNPAGGLDSARAEKTYELWHQREPKNAKVVRPRVNDGDLMVCVGNAHSIVYASNKWEKDTRKTNSYIHHFDSKPKVWMLASVVPEGDVRSNASKTVGELLKNARNKDGQFACADLARPESFAIDEESNELKISAGARLLGTIDRKTIVILDPVLKLVVVRGGAMYFDERGIVK